jgi:acetylornithine deacetylase/succinyl-diaminopimelate desuccinylase-like protein
MDAITLLQELVAIDSVFPNEMSAAEFCEMFLIENGFQIQRQEISPGRFNLLAERGTKGRSLLFYGHLDTVPAYGTWQADPLKIRSSSDKLIGLGTVDMKAGVAAILKATEEESDRRIKVVLGVDEENLSAGAHAVAASKFLDDVEFGICTESPAPLGLAHGPQAICLGRRGRCVIELTVPGRSAHGANPFQGGINAIDEAARLILELERLGSSLPKHEVLPPATQFVRSMEATTDSLSVPDSAILQLDRHLVPPETPESALSSTQEFIAALYREGKFQEIDGKGITARLKVRSTPYLRPYATPITNPNVQKLGAAVASQALGNPLYTYGLSAADESIFAAKGIPMATIGPAGGNEHSAEEWVSQSSYLKLIEVLKTFIRSC